MHIRSIATVVLYFAANNLCAATLDDVRRSLTALRGDVPATVKIDFRDQRTKKKDKSEIAGSSVVEDSGTHIRIVHDKTELRRRTAKKGRPDEGLSAIETFELMNYAPIILKAMDGATLKRTSQTTLDGAPVTLFEINPVREKDEDGDKWIKEYADTLLLWTDAAGVPVAAEHTMKLKARIVIIGIEFNRHEKLRFARAADRLLVVRRTSQESSSGMGQSESGVKNVTVALVR